MTPCFCSTIKGYRAWGGGIGLGKDLSGLELDAANEYLDWLGCASMSPWQPMLQAELGLPMVDGVRCGLVMLEGLVRAGLKTSKVNGYRPG